MRRPLPVLGRRGPGQGTCDSVVAYHFDRGTIRGVDVAGRRSPESCTSRATSSRATGGSSSIIDDERHRRAGGRDARRVHRQARRSARGPGRSSSASSSPSSGRRSRTRSSTARVRSTVRRQDRPRDAALHGAGRHDHDAQQLDLLDGAGLAGLRREGSTPDDQHPRARLPVVVRRTATRSSPTGSWTTEKCDAVTRARRVGARLARLAAPPSSSRSRWRGRSPWQPQAGRAAARLRRTTTPCSRAGRRSGSRWSLFLLAWQVMVAAMMLPSSLPLMRLFAAASARAAAPGPAMAGFLGGYALVWSVFGALRSASTSRCTRRSTPSAVARRTTIGSSAAACSRSRAPSSSRR